MLKALETRTNLTDEGIVASDEKAMQIDAEMKAQAAEDQKKVEQAEGMAQVSELVKLLNDIGIGKSSPGAGNKPRDEGGQ
jgi:hypothetical protein